MFFGSGRRVLVQAKDGGGGGGTGGGNTSEPLQRPKPFDYATTSAGGKPVGENS